MSQPLFDTFKYVKLLTEHHFSQLQVQGLMSAQIMVLQSLLDRLVTRKDLQRTEFSLRTDLLESEYRLRAEIAGVRDELKTEIRELKHELKTEIAKVDARITTTASELKAFTLKNTIATILAVLGLNIAIMAALGL